MMDKELTRQMLGEVGPLRFNPYVMKICQGCQTPHRVRYKGSNKPTSPFHCPTCIANRPSKKAASKAGALNAWQDDSYREMIVANSKKIWEDPERARKMSSFRNSPEFKVWIGIFNKAKVDDEFRNKLSSIMLKRWDDPKYRSKMAIIASDRSRKAWTTKEYRDKISETTRQSWMNPEYRLCIVESTRRLWHDDGYRNKTVKAIAYACSQPEFIAKLRLRWEDPVFREKMRCQARVSSLQTTLYSLLDDLNIVYYRERDDGTDDPQCTIGPYSFDCVVPRPGRPTLLIECQGDYWHNKPGIQQRDQAKASYVANLPEYELKCLWEHEFRQLNRIADTVRYWMGFSAMIATDFDFDSTEIRDCPASDYKLLLSKYHYLVNAGRGGIAYGAYLGDVLIGACIFSPLGRQNIAGSLGSTDSEARELSRLCIHPSYQKHNFASWFVSRCLKRLPPKYTTIVSYCDTTFNHNGATYKACNFIQDSVVPADYWYATSDGWVMHKRTLYGHAVRMHSTEGAYAEEHGYRKIWGKEKLRFIYRR